MSSRITLADSKEAINFRTGFVVRPSVWQRSWWSDLFRRIFWWRQQRMIVTRVDREAGEITMRPMRWSWLHWRWEIAE